MKPVLHLMVTNTCHLNCPLCCNKQYNVEEIPVVTVNDLKNTETICITGGEPIFFLNNVRTLIIRIKRDYKNIKNIYLYTTGRRFIYTPEIDGYSIGPKTFKDWMDLIAYITAYAPFGPHSECMIQKLKSKSNRLYVFPEWEQFFNTVPKEIFEGFTIIHREWQKDFKPTPNSIFRRIPVFY